MRLKLIACMALLAGCLSGAAIAAEKHVPLQKTIGGTSHPVPSLAVLNSRGATLDGNKLTLTGVTPNSIIFSDRPARSAGHILTSDFIKHWSEGKDSFAADPPNATISVLGGADGTEVKDAVVVLKSPKIEGDNLSFEVSVLEGDLTGASGPASLFIDWFVAGRGWGYHPWHHAGAFYAGAAVGAAVGAAAAYGAPYYYPPPRCGYYPYPPCY